MNQSPNARKVGSTTSLTQLQTWESNAAYNCTENEKRLILKNTNSIIHCFCEGALEAVITDIYGQYVLFLDDGIDSPLKFDDFYRILLGTNEQIIGPNRNFCEFRKCFIHFLTIKEAR